MMILNDPQQKYIDAMPEGEDRDLMKEAFLLRNAIADGRVVPNHGNTVGRERIGDFCRLVDRTVCK